MGRQASVNARVDGEETSGVAQLESTDVRFRADGSRRWLKVPFTSAAAVSVESPWLRISHPGGQLELALGGEAAQWAERIRSPRSRLDKLGIGPGTRLALRRVEDPDFLQELHHIGVVSCELGREGADVIVTGIEDLAQVDELPAMVEGLADKGSIWLVHRKGRSAIPDAELRAAWGRYGLVDTKVSAFSPTHTATQLRRRRPR